MLPVWLIQSTDFKSSKQNTGKKIHSDIFI